VKNPTELTYPEYQKLVNDMAFYIKSFEDGSLIHEVCYKILSNVFRGYSISDCISKNQENYVLGGIEMYLNNKRVTKEKVDVDYFINHVLFILGFDFKQFELYKRETLYRKSSPDRFYINGYREEKVIHLPNSIMGELKSICEYKEVIVEIWEEI